MRNKKRFSRPFLGSILLGLMATPSIEGRAAEIASTTAVNITPTQSDFAIGYKVQPAAIVLQVTGGNVPNGCTITVRGESLPQLRNEDLLIKSSSAGTTSQFTVFKALSSSEQALWHSESTVDLGTAVVLDVQVQRLKNYPAGTDLTNRLTFTLLPNP